MTEFARNNLDKASSPYLQQHQENPIWWQEWTQEALEYAREQGKLVFVSIGYATCHWCHVMARESFSDSHVADFLNQHFVSIKVDREQRPDIDQYFMAYLTETTGSGGWPLNAFVTADLRMLFAGTYFPPVSRPEYNLPSFLEILQQIVSFYKEKGVEAFKHFQPEIARERQFEESELLNIISDSFDQKYGGFGGAPKFPSHNTLLFLMSVYANRNAHFDMQFGRHMIQETLDIMPTRGLHDHLQGGFYRYCVDRDWTVPHFEKMLYDQAMMLMNYSAAYKLFGDDLYKKVVKKLLKCLEETFALDGLYVSAHDADTNHEEGATYLWGFSQLQQVLSRSELQKFAEVYQLSEQGNFEGKNHLLKLGREDFQLEEAGSMKVSELENMDASEGFVKSKNVNLQEIEERLLQVRKNRPQPFVDRKIVTSWNALLGIGLVFAWRYAGIPEARKRAIDLLEKLLAKHYRDGRLFHSSLGNHIQEKSFLEDYAAVLLLVTYLYEEVCFTDKNRAEKYKKLMAVLRAKMQEFYQDGWMESADSADFPQIQAQKFDHPVPASESLAEMALYRTQLILAADFADGISDGGLPDGEFGLLSKGQSGQESFSYRTPLNCDFYNLAIFQKKGNQYILHVPEPIPWADLPFNTIQLPADFIQKKGQKAEQYYEVCAFGECQHFDSPERLLQFLKSYQ